MIDIHTHIIHCVDDGSKSLEDSIQIIVNEIEQGVTDIICTPHYRLGMFETSGDQCKENFEILKSEVIKRKLPVNLYFGREVYYHQNALNTVLSSPVNYCINNTNIVLLEFSYTRNPDIEEIIYQFKRRGFQVIIAHIERYQYLNDIDDIRELKKMGALIQINASTIAGKHTLKEKHKVLKYIKEGLVDFVASDIHATRTNYMKKAYDIVAKKYGKDCALKLFGENAQMIILPNEEIAV